MEIDLKKTLEALLLSTAEPISLEELVQVFARHHSQVREALEAEKASEEELTAIFGPATQAQISAAIDELINVAEIEDKAYRIIEGPNGYQIVTAPQFAEYVRLLRGEPRPTRLSPAALETLSIVAYRQPVTRAEMEAIRGVSVDGPLNRLIELELVHVTGRSELPGRPIQYGTTDKFLEFVGIKDLDELPASDVLDKQEVDDWIRRDTESQTQVSDLAIKMLVFLKIQSLTHRRLKGNIMY
jgi:segregation and condensation protein B